MAGTKLPRRTMSMAKRATKLAEDAAEVDAVEAMIGESEGRVTFADGLVAWVAAIVGIVILMFATTLICGTGDSDFSPAGPLSREEPDTFYQEGDPTDGRMGTGRDSPFPDAQQVEPIILEVVCPTGTVHISTGTEASDSFCVIGELAGQPGSTIGATTVPPLHCAEDELIGYTRIEPVPVEGLPLGCVHVDAVNEQ